MKRTATILSLLLCITMAPAQDIVKHHSPSKTMVQKKQRTPSAQKTEQAKPAKQKEEKVYDIAEQQPSFPGGVAALMKYLRDNIRYPEAAMEAQVQGRVTVQFVVEKDGSISDVRVVRSVESSLDKEAIRLVEAMPRWTLGRQNGVIVRVRYRVPVLFHLQ